MNDFIMQWGQANAESCQQVIYFNTACPFSTRPTIFCQNKSNTTSTSGGYLGNYINTTYIDSTGTKGFRAVADQTYGNRGFDWIAIGK